MLFNIFTQELRGKTSDEECNEKSIEHNVYTTFIAFYDFLKTMFKILFSFSPAFDTLRSRLDQF